MYNAVCTDGIAPGTQGACGKRNDNNVAPNYGIPWDKMSMHEKTQCTLISKSHNFELRLWKMCQHALISILRKEAL